jgi:4-amino-4-deoxy-L-arabinose transferase-like glycosyltransferase
MNYIAQHPPLYYLGAGAFLKVAAYFTQDPTWLFKAPRVMSVLSGALTLVMLYALIFLVTADRQASLGIPACISCIPMFSHLSSGTNNDTTVTLLAVLAVYCWIRFLKEKKMIYVYLMAIWLTLACATKMTAVLLIPPMLVILILEMKMPWRLRIRHLLAISSISFLLPVFWLIRSSYKTGAPLSTFVAMKSKTELIQASFFDYISQKDALESIFIHFWGMFGSPLSLRDIGLQRIEGWPLTFYTLSSLLIVSILALAMIVRFFVMARRVNNPRTPGSQSIIEWWYTRIGDLRSSGAASWGLLALSLMIGIYAYHLIFSSPAGGLRLLFFSVSFFVLCLSMIMFLIPLDEDERLVCSSLLVIAFFVSLFMWKLYGIYLGAGWARALQGRYFFPLIPLMLTSTSLALIRWVKIPSWVLLVFALAFTMAELATLLGQIIPLWRNL